MSKVAINSERLLELLGYLGGLQGVPSIVESLARKIAELYGVDRVSLRIISDSQEFSYSASLDSAAAPQFLPFQTGLNAGEDLIATNRLQFPIVINDVSSRSPTDPLRLALQRVSSHSAMIFRIYRPQLRGFLELHQTQTFREWTEAEKCELNIVISSLEALLDREFIRSTDSDSDTMGFILGHGFPGIAVEIDSNGIVQFVSNRTRNYYIKAPAKPFGGARFEDLFDHLFAPEIRPLAQSAVLRVLGRVDESGSFESNLLSNGLSEQHAFTFRVVKFKRGALVVGILTGLASLDTSKLSALKLSYRKLLEASNTVIIRTDPFFSVTEVIGNAAGVFGIEEKRFVRGGLGLWARLIHREDLAKLRQRIGAIFSKPSEFAEEFRIINQKNGEIRHLLGRGVPILGSNEEVLGWEGIGVDITDIRQAEDELRSQKARIEALYEVARSLQLNLDPSMVALKGLKALISATASASGMVLFYDERTGNLEIAATQGLSTDYVEEAERLVNGPSLVRFAIEHCESIRVDNIQDDTRAIVKIAKPEGLKATIVTPLEIGKKVFGAVVLFRNEAKAFIDSDLELVQAASHQIAMATIQAQLYSSEKRQADYFGALYRLSHELSGYLSPTEISLQAFQILNREVACKRLWLGVMNEQGTHLVGQAGFGPGVRKRIIELQIEIDRSSNNPIVQAIVDREPVVVTGEDAQSCHGLELIMNKLQPGPFVIIPLVSLGQAIGALFVEPVVSIGFFTQARLSFLASMANEIAVVLVANRFHSKIAEADKMRMAGLFASGVAHNFNNMLQAILGQASLLEMQAKEDSPIHDAAAMIKGAAHRGAGLIKQLLNFSINETRAKERLSISEFLDQSKDLYKAILGSSIEFLLNVSDEYVDVIVDRSQFQQVMTNLVINAKEALVNGRGRVSITSNFQKLSSGEVNPELSPGEYVRIDVKDTGTGMNDEQLARCFEPFFTTKNVDAVTGIGVTGSGLGLSSAYSIMKQHEGLITAQSKKGEGSTFTIYLPIAQRDRQIVPSNLISVYCLGIEPVHGLRLVNNLGLSQLEVSQVKTAADFFSRIEINKNPALIIIDAEKESQNLKEIVNNIESYNLDYRVLVQTFFYDQWQNEFKDSQHVVILQKPISSWILREEIKALQRLSKSNLSSKVAVSKQVVKSQDLTLSTTYESEEFKISNEK